MHLFDGAFSSAVFFSPLAIPFVGTAIPFVSTTTLSKQTELFGQSFRAVCHVILLSSETD